ncbi:MAG: NnrS family protein [Rhodobacterales bacterium CG15_BIG_FIL_POST_REV_8_21_14_020_59_13]|nr:MAG: NnrS family protein [Rhodobacterales bacterium CG15_BIG_FIL_POST_REV_8_21_14_020_59_13]
MTEPLDRGAHRRAAPPILQNAFRPFFLGGAVWAALFVPLWISEYLGWTGFLHGMTGHAHEMLYGFLAAIICGFALTAIPNWTGRAPVAGTGLAGLFALWLVGRVAYLADGGAWISWLDHAFLPVLSAVVIREILAGKNWRNLPIALLIVLFTLSHLAFHFPDLRDAAVRATFAAAILLIALIGGRIVPSFTRNWLAPRNAAAVEHLASPMQMFDKLIIGLTAAAVAGWTVFPHAGLTGILLMAAGTGQLARLSRWQGINTLSEPLVWSLHAGFLWLFLSLLLTGASIVLPGHVPPAAGLHAISAGLVGSMTLAVMTRASLGHTGRPRTAGLLTTLIYASVQLGAVLRVLSAFQNNDSVLLVPAAILWSGAFALFAIGYAPMLWGAKPPVR